MSIFIAMNAAVSGMRAMGQQISAISDNLANTQTVGYKKVDMRFQELVTSSNPNRHNAGGVTSTPLLQASLQGSIQRTTSSSNIAIDGPGFFSVSQALVRTDGIKSFDMNLYTRAGDFEVDKDGYMVNSAGYYLNGWAVKNPDAAKDSEKQAVTQTLTPVRIDRMQDSPLPTSYLQYSANLPKAPDPLTDDTVLKKMNADGTINNDIELAASQLRVYDKAGEARDLSMNWVKINAPTTTYSTYNATVGAGTAGISRVSFTVGTGADATPIDLDLPAPAPATDPDPATWAGTLDGLVKAKDPNLSFSYDAATKTLTLTDTKNRALTQPMAKGDVVADPVLDAATVGSYSFTVTNADGTVTPIDLQLSAPASDPASLAKALDGLVKAKDPKLAITYSAGPPAALAVSDSTTLADGTPAPRALSTPEARASVKVGAFGAASTSSQTTVPVPGSPDTGGLWRLEMSMKNGDLNGAADGTGATYFVKFDDAGKLQWVSANSTPAPGEALKTTIPLAITDTDTKSQWGFDLRLGDPGDGSGGLTQYASDGIQLGYPEQDGRPMGVYQSMSIDQFGFVNLTYSNGRTVPVFKVPLTTVPNPSGLALQSGAAFRETPASGKPMTVSAGESGAGTFAPTSIEASTVDVSEEFTKMITAQRSYSANAKMVTVSDEMLQETIGIVR